ncbi:hypothetical protein [Acetobacter oryzoeni]|uniref:Uncharacterized protein n=1 Tax=Acetobacter oryzoeni TaxID=2500548 RepID=A0A5B9GMT9_9PROT|nr:hypothetical protein [Acetobacter oryzoeni]MCP1202270.1 hypothetical protein [Acetobacter oryzoeni]QEE85996.1 hypothetical protein EOV40_009950 [Acetobacter oryzoeni]
MRKDTMQENLTKPDLIGWHEWPTNRRKDTQELRTDLPPIHEPEPGLLDEEILPLHDDWMKGPKG